MFLEWDDPVVGRVKGAGVAPKFSDTPGGVWRGAPWLGQDNQRVYSELLGLSEGEIRSLLAAGVIGEKSPEGPPSSKPAFYRQKGL